MLLQHDNAIIDFGEEESEFYYHHIHRTQPFERNNHYHGTYEIYYLLAGERNYFIKEKLYPIQAGALVLINKYDVHKTSVRSHPEHERIVINFSDSFLGENHPMHDPELLDIFKQDQPYISLRPVDQSAVLQLFKKMEQEITEQDTAFDSYIRILLTELLIQANRFVARSENQPEAMLNPLHQKITDIVKFIHHHYDNKITLDILSESFFISPYYLSRVFKEITGFTIISYVNLTRIREAQRLLRDTDIKIIDIAEMTGFESLTHFDRTFKKTVSMTASRYRKLYTPES